MSKEPMQEKQEGKEKYDTSTGSFAQGLCRGSRGFIGASQIPRVDTSGALIARAMLVCWLVSLKSI